MRIWLDTEFHEDGRTIDLISVGLVAADGRVLHLASSDYDATRATDWLRDNVLCHLGRVPHVPRHAIRDAIERFVGTETPEFWAYFGAYDWIALQQLFGNMFAWPKGWPLLYLDVEQWRMQLAVPKSDMPPQRTAPHDALNDALWTREAWQYLCDVAERRRDTASSRS